MSFGLHCSAINTHQTLYFYSMTASFTASQTKVNQQLGSVEPKTATSEQVTSSSVSYKQAWVFVLQLTTGEYVVGTASNPSRRISSINSGMNKSIPVPLSVYRVVGVREQTEERTLISVTKQLCERYGSERILVV